MTRATSASPAIRTDADPSSETIVLVLLDVEFGATGIDVDTDLLERGHLDSLAVLDLVIVVEETFGIELNDDDVVPEHFRSVRDLAGLIDRRRS